MNAHRSSSLASFLFGLFLLAQTGVGLIAADTVFNNNLVVWNEDSSYRIKVYNVESTTPRYPGIVTYNFRGNWPFTVNQTYGNPIITMITGAGSNTTPATVTDVGIVAQIDSYVYGPSFNPTTATTTLTPVVASQILTTNDTAWDNVQRQSSIRFSTVANGGSGAVERMCLSGPNLGIGTTTPRRMLSVNGPGGFGPTTGCVSFQNAGAQTNERSLWMQYNTTNNMGEIQTEYNGQPTPYRPLTLNRLGGGVCIGNTQPIGAALLTVNGGIVAKDIVIQSTGFTVWADYVFDETYRLRPLAEVAASIKADHHLPGLPAAADIERHGLTLATIARQQMEKIEELTLYAIQADAAKTRAEARIAALEEEAAQAKTENSKLQQTLESLAKRLETLEQKRAP